MTKDQIKKVGIVLRVSTSGQVKDDQADSIDDQLKAATAWAESQGWAVVKVYDETEEKGYQSGRSKLEDRPKEL